MPPSPGRDRTKAHAWLVAHGEGVRAGEYHTPACRFIQLLIEEHEAREVAMLDMLRSIEWSGSAGRCPHCQQWPETGPTDGLGNPTHEGHAKDCALAALIGAL